MINEMFQSNPCSECLKLEADESPYVHWVNSRYRVNTKLLIMTLRRSYQYLTIVRYVT